MIDFVLASPVSIVRQFIQDVSNKAALGILIALIINLSLVLPECPLLEVPHLVAHVTPQIIQDTPTHLNITVAPPFAVQMSVICLQKWSPSVFSKKIHITCLPLSLRISFLLTYPVPLSTLHE
eukprot:NODE_42_length_34079_cov_0.552619.p22 type:complete len:123 gc:universal NODE_42_length_34079_cov_0.552619:31368-31736(+)